MAEQQPTSRVRINLDGRRTTPKPAKPASNDKPASRIKFNPRNGSQPPSALPR
ncbi:hypothetical protein ACFT8P_13965 [Streptomyces sp. NPDC057101]|uniref:hypothetical protein n=1 Tax=Streptomyces sp. NPDC057101 TaxID=3346020 RepID=UPI003626B6A7